MSAAAEPLLFPLFLKLAGRKVLVVGAGTVAASKLLTLRGTGARITVVAPAVGDALRAAADDTVAIEQRPFAPADLSGAWLVIAAATPEVNRAVALSGSSA